MTQTPTAAAPLRGIFVPLVTPFTEDGSHIEAAALEQLAHQVLRDGAAGLVALGTTAEAAALSPDERREVVAVCARVCREHGARLIVGAGTNDTAGTAAALSALGGGPGPLPDAALVAVPPFVRPSEDGVVAHFAHAAEHSPVPLVVYHVPYRTGRALSVETLRRLAEIPGVVGIKHAVGAVDADTVDLLGEPPEGFAVLAGDDVFAGALFALGAAGGILASAHVATSSFVDLHAAWGAGDVARARGLGADLARLSAALFAEPNPTVVKGVLHALGHIPSPAVRLPLLRAGARSVEVALDALERVDTRETERPGFAA
ncbi:dihydrodipicolinate synthase family protein [Yinghuangia seranimata]|uniref:dihydrodipicolinate synthase family protein n=1 Tax=Yinghuangia seranimata TaxID=408067 RepID=UPI00248ACF6E|nr:dihydrodipicolinate synthase family protein [Yinghuangia seranimata]MDI2126474.1 dihydrodipicolinate synthase family protein [Yinghuangia seranimata]